jgi:hypothetical protein
LAKPGGELARHVEPSVFPTDKEGLLASASRQTAPQDVMATSARLPDGKTFQTFEEVWETLGGPNF